jgi:plastocyanin
VLTAVRTLTLATAVAVLLLSGSAAPAQQPGSPVHGRVEIGIPVPAKRPTSAAYPGRTVAQPELAPVSELRNVVVYLKDAPARPQPPIHAEIRQNHETFMPRVVAVPVGSTVDFPNDDNIFHNVFSLSAAKNFNLGRYPRGKSKSVTFEKPGLVRVFCDIHSHMSATVMVFNHPWYAIPDENGNFQLPEVPTGKRQITAWHERLGDTTLPVSINMEFILPVPAK